MLYPDWLTYVVCNSDLDVLSISSSMLSLLGIDQQGTKNLTNLFPSVFSAPTLTKLREILYRIRDSTDLHHYTHDTFLLSRDNKYTELKIVELLPGKRFVLLAHDASYQLKILSLERKIDQLSKALDFTGEGCCVVGHQGDMDYISLPFQQTLTGVLSHVTHVSQYQTFSSLIDMLKQECCSPTDAQILEEKLMEEKLMKDSERSKDSSVPLTLHLQHGTLYFRVICSFHKDYFYKILFVKRVSVELESSLPVPHIDVEHCSTSTAQEIKDQALSSVFHELKTPLFGIYSSLELIEPEKLDPEVLEFFDLIRGGIDILSMHINNVLEVSQLKASSAAIIPEACSINVVVGRVLDVVSNMIQINPIDVNTFTSLICHSVLELDHYHLERILVCLLTNAVQNTYNGNVSLSADCVSNDGNSAEVKFMIKDTGIGIPCKYQPYIFEPFVSIPDTVNRTPGLGLGLTIAKLACELLNGELSFESEENVSSIFYFTLKLSIKKHLSSPFEGKSVLLVSDQQSRADSVAAQLREWGMAVEPDSSCSSLAKLLKLLKRASFDICILDKPFTFLESMVTLSTDKMFRNVSVCFMADQTRKKITIASLEANQFPVLRWPIQPDKWVDLLSDVLLQRKKLDIVSLPPIAPTLFQDRLVICAEDNEASQRLMQLMLGKKLGFNVIIVENGVELCEKVKEFYDDIFALITDLRMPKMDGREAITIIREWEDQAKAETRVPIIVLSAEPSKALSEALNAGASFFLNKPLELTELTKIMTCIDNERQIRQSKLS
ncbi:hypothetical protein P9112_008242 [Eukaryota sp. TZLM1-RC]